MKIMKHLIVLLTVWSIAIQAGSIVVSGDISKLEQLGAEELKTFLEPLSGDTWNIVEENHSAAINEPIIWLGRTDFARSHGIDAAKADKEEWILQSVSPENLIVSGGRPAGTLYGVYELLEKMGVRFLTFEDTVIPAATEFLLPVCAERGQPNFAGRCIYDAYPSMLSGQPERYAAYMRFRLRTRQNSSQGAWEGCEYVGDYFRLTTPWCHNFYYYVDPKEYFPTHPEYFSMDEKGVRFYREDHGSQLCLSNPEVAAAAERKLRETIVRDRAALPPDEWPTIYDISQRDSAPYICLCAACREIVAQEGSESGLVIGFVNRIASAIATDYPEVQIRTFAYMTTDEAPRHLRPRENVLVQLCPLYTQTDCYRPLSSAFNTISCGKLESWRAAGTRLAIWWYWNMGLPGYYDPPLPETVFGALTENTRYFADSGVRSLFIEAEKNFSTPQSFLDLCIYVETRLMLHPEADADGLAREFIDGCYGDAAPVIAEYFEMLRQGVTAQKNPQPTCSVSRWDFLTPEFLWTWYRKLGACVTVENSPAAARKIRAEMIPLGWTMLFYHHDCAEYLAQRGIDPEQFKEEVWQLTVAERTWINPATAKAELKELRKRFDVITSKTAIPEKFRDWAPERLRVFNADHAVELEFHNSHVVDDPDSSAGKALKSAKINDALHGTGTTVAGVPTLFAYYDFQPLAAGESRPQLHVTSIPSDEQYHWYHLGTIRLAPKMTFYGHCWWIQFDLSQAWRHTDGLAGGDEYELWFSAKFTGPAYVAGSTRENAIWVDYVVVVQ